MTDGFADDLDALAELGFGLEGFEQLASSGAMPEGAFATFTRLEPDIQQLVLRLCDKPTADDFREMDELPEQQRVTLARWLLTLPSFNGPAIDDEDDQGEER